MSKGTAKILAAMKLSVKFELQYRFYQPCPYFIKTSIIDNSVVLCPEYHVPIKMGYHFFHCEEIACNRFFVKIQFQKVENGSRVKEKPTIYYVSANDQICLLLYTLCLCARPFYNGYIESFYIYQCFMFAFRTE